MTHEQVRELLPLYLDNELDAERRAAVEAALNAHPEIRRELERWSALHACIRRAARAPATPEGFEQRLRTRLHAARRTSSPMRRLVLFGTLAAACIAFLTFGPRLSLKSDNPNQGGGQYAALAELLPTQFGQVARYCREHDHSISGSESLDIQAARAFVQDHMPYPVTLPDLRQRGLRYRGCCQCVPRPNQENRVQAMQVRYIGTDENDSIAIFAMAARIDLRGCRKAKAPEWATSCGYQEAEADGMSYIKWTQDKVTYVIAAQRPLEELRQIAAQCGVPNGG